VPPNGPHETVMRRSTRWQHQARSSLASDLMVPTGRTKTITGFYGRNYDVTADGQRFVVVEPVGDAPAPKIRVVLNWFEEFRDRQ